MNRKIDQDNEKNVDFLSLQIENGKYYFGDISLKNSPQMRVVCAGKEACKPSYNLKRNGFQYYAVEFIADGDWTLDCGGKKYSLSSGSFFAYSPSSNFTLSSNCKKPSTKYFVDFIGRNAPSILDDSGISLLKPIKVVQMGWLTELWGQILNCERFAKNSSGDIATLIFKTLLRIVQEEFISGNKPSCLSYQTYMKCYDYICNNFYSIRRVSDISKVCFVEEAYMCRLFNRYADDTPMHFVMHLKIHYAVDLLIRQKLSISETSDALGFKDQYHFSRVFKKILGASPRNYIESVCNL